MDPKIDLSSIICWMVQTSRADFFARLLMSIPTRKKRMHNTCMALSFTKQGYVVHWDPEYLKTATLDHVMYVLYHEMHHFILGHIPRQLRLHALYKSKGKQHLFSRIAWLAVDLPTDEETRNYAPKLVERALKSDFAPPLLPGVAPFEDVPAGQTFEWYAEYFINKLQDEPEPEGGGGGDGKGGKDGEQDEDRTGGGGLDEVLTWVEQKDQELDDKSDDYRRGFAAGARQAQRDRKSGEGDQTPSPAEGESQDYKDGYADGYNQGKDAPDLEPLTGALERGIPNPIEDIDTESGEMTTDELLARAEELENQTQRIVKQTVEAHMKSRGTLPGNLKSYIEDLLTPPRVPWTKILRNKVINTQRYRRVRSVGRPRRRHIGVPRLMKFPGHSKERRFTVAFCLDTSCSMGQEELQQAMSELQGLQKADSDIEIHVVECDASVGRVYTVGPHDEIKREVTGRGGTTFDPAVIKAKELNPDIVFYFTDGYAPALQVENRVVCPFVWVVTPGGKVPDPDYGFAIHTGENTSW